MKLIEVNLIYCLIFTMFSCQNGNTVDLTQKTSNTNNIVPIQVERNENVILKKTFKSIDILKLKKDFNRSTSGKISNRQSSHFNRKQKEGFFGHYFLLNKEKPKGKIPFIGKLVVFSNDSLWLYSSANESLVELTTYSNEISILPKLKIGMTKEKVGELFNSPGYSKNDFSFHHGGAGLILTVKYQQDTVYGMRIGTYKNDTVYSSIISTFYH